MAPYRLITSLSPSKNLSLTFCKSILGDVGQWNPNGTLKIIDRKKHIFKLSQGEYIVPEKIENAYIKSPYVEQVFVHGESLKVRNPNECICEF